MSIRCSCGNALPTKELSEDPIKITCDVPTCNRSYLVKIVKEYLPVADWDEKCKTCANYQCWYSEENCHPRLGHPLYEEKQNVTSNGVDD